MKFPYRAVIAVCVVLAVILGVYNAYVYFFTGIKTQIALYGTIETRINTDGYVIRDEHILVDEPGRFLSSTVSDGERVSAGAAVASLYSTEVDSSVLFELAKINERIINLERKSSIGKSVHRDSAGTESTVKENISKIMKYVHHGNGIELREVSLLLEEAVDEKIASSSEKSIDVMGQLRARKSELEQSITGEKSEVYADASGLYFSYVDGFEGLLEYDSSESLLPQHITELDKVTVDKSAGAHAKIVDGFDWCLAVMLSSDDLSIVKKGDRVDIRFNGYSDKNYSAEVEYISEEQDGRRVVVLKSDEYCEYVYYNRRVNADVVFNRSSGIKFSKDAIRIKDSQTGVYVLTESVARFKAVEVLANDGTDVVVRENNGISQGLLLYDEIVVKGNVEDNQIIR